ncbi:MULTISPECIES: nucleotidyltransferase family protein [Helcococcus]|uniref:tRNA(Met) cytidine acetate ligase n=1 Tax=Helcococcus bovis TaxID=3153252 RepID=A0ABW9F5J1_9FIRM
MTNIAIICEYNPMHNGHLHQIKKIKEKFPESNIIALMSTSFVQRGEPSIIGKFDKTRSALKCGVDLVFEIPAIISLQSADYFSYYTTFLLNELGLIDYISFGIEDDTETFYKLLDFKIKNESKIFELQGKYIKQGYSYKNAYLQAIYEIDKNVPHSIISPNNTLALNYALTLNKLNSKIKILPIQRKDGGYNSEKLDKYKFQSATTIRNLIKKNYDVSNYVPDELIEILKNTNLHNIDEYSNIFYYKAFIEKNTGESIAGFEPGILNLLKKNYSDKISNMIEKSHNKRYSKSRLKRFIINYLLDIETVDIKNLDKINYLRPIGFNDKGRDLINQLKNLTDFTILNKLVDYVTLDDVNRNFAEIDIRAYELQNLNNTKILNKNFKNRIYIK